MEIYLSGMFWEGKFNGDISGWDVSGVKYMEGMFDNSKKQKSWWYIEDNKEREKTIAKRKESIGLKERIESELDFHKNTIQITKNKSLKL